MSSICSLFQIAINENEFIYEDLPCNSFAERLKKAKYLKGLSQHDLVKLTGLSRSTISDLEAGYRDTISKDTLYKLLKVFDKNIICDDYLNYIMDQEKNITNLISLYGLNNLSQLLGVHRSTLERWRDGRFQISREIFKLIEKIKDQD